MDAHPNAHAFADFGTNISALRDAFRLGCSHCAHYVLKLRNISDAQ